MMFSRASCTTFRTRANGPEVDARNLVIVIFLKNFDMASLNKLNMKQRYSLEIILGTISNELGLQKNDFFEQLSRAQEITGSVA